MRHKIFFIIYTYLFHFLIYILKRFIPGNKILMLYFLLTFSGTKQTVVLLQMLLVSVPTKQIETFPPSTSVMSQVLALQQGASQLQTSKNLRTFSVNITSPLRIHFPLLNPVELHHYCVTFIVLLPSIKF
jgi:hypothetical protein